MTTNITNRYTAFYDLIKNAIVGNTNNRYQTNYLVNFYDDIQSKEIELLIELNDDNLVTRYENEGYGSLYEEREQNFSVLMRLRIKQSKDVIKSAREAVSAHIERLQRCLLQNISFDNYEIVVSQNVWNKVTINDLKINTVASLLGETTEVIVEGSILYTFST